MKTLADLMRESGEPTDTRANGETHYPCPKCGGTDRFLVRPDGERGYCRQCNWQPDAIQYLREIEGKSYPAAAKEVGKEIPPLDPAVNKRAQRLKADFERWRGQMFTLAYQSLYSARQRLLSAQFAQSCYRLAPSTFTPEEMEQGREQLVATETHFQAMQEAFLLLSEDGDEGEAIKIWQETVE